MGIAVGRDVPAELSFDICIIGAGASGLTIASNFLAKNLVVGILESGDAGDRPLASDPGEPAKYGLPYAKLSTSRLRGFGGSTQKLGWGGVCKPLDPQDFLPRPWVANSGWPFGFEQMRPYYDRSRETLGLGCIDTLASRRTIFPGRSDLVSSDTLELCRHYRLGGHLRRPVEQSKAVNVLTNVTLLYFEFGGDGTAICAAHCVDAEGRRFRVVSKAFVLAAGGIENARLLLLSNQAAERPQGLAGRYFMDHPRFTIGTLTPADSKVRKIFACMDRIRVARMQRIVRKLKLDSNRRFHLSGLTLPFSVQEDEGLLNYRAWVEPCYIGQDSQALDKMKLSLLDYRDKIIQSGQPQGWGQLLKEMNWTKGMHIARPLSLARSFRLHHFIEPEPLASSAVSLSSNKDRHGLALVSLRWQLSSSTLDSLRRTIQILQQELLRSGLGRLDVASDEWALLERPMWTWHHMGTTRMHIDASKGVVDENCRVHGVRNLFVAGSSVFPTVGNDTPTMTVVALAHRLSDHLLQFVT
ncbi:MAG: dependent oxidoreductase [Rhizobium sp.]|nr:dependent oxidoreductase [Rhizobium sp.]